jgi:hypothetical protein
VVWPKEFFRIEAEASRDLLLAKEDYERTEVVRPESNNLSCFLVRKRNWKTHDKKKLCKGLCFRQMFIFSSSEMSLRVSVV